MKLMFYYYLNQSKTNGKPMENFTKTRMCRDTPGLVI